MTYRERMTADDDIRCHNKQKADIRFHDGALPHVKGACCYQVVRAAKDPSVSMEGRGFTYNHAAMLCYFHGHFIYEYLSGPQGEHEAPSAVFMCVSGDGIHWGKPVEAFPAIRVPSAPYRGPKKEQIQSETVDAIVHHRMGFYTSSDGRLLISTFYGISPDFHTAPNNGYGVGRGVREIYEDFSMSPVYFLRFNLPGGYSGENTHVFPYFEESEDEGFKAACRELLGNRLVTQQWWEEERLDERFFTRPGGRALSYYTLPSGRVMGVFKDSLTSYSDDGGETWSQIKKSYSIETSSGKVWGQKTPDGNYALCYNPTPDSAHRWPLAMQVSENGIDFDRLMAIVPEVAPCRYEGKLKNLGPQYVRGITEANGYPDDEALWLVYSVNKEDMWVSRVPVPAVSGETEDVHEDLTVLSEETLRNHWNLYVPAWNHAELRKGKGLYITDCDPYDRCRAMRLFRAGTVTEITVKLLPVQLRTGKIAVVIQDRKGQNLISAVLRSDGNVCVRNAGYEKVLCPWHPGKELTLTFRTDCVENRVKAGADGRFETEGYLAASTEGAERVLIASKYDLPWQTTEANGKDGNIGNLPDADKKQEETQFYVLELVTKAIEL